MRGLDIESRMSKQPNSPEVWRNGMKLDNTVLKVNDGAHHIDGLVEGEKFEGPVFLQYPNTEPYGLLGLRQNHMRAFDYLKITTSEGEETYDIKGAGYSPDLNIYEWFKNNTETGVEHLGLLNKEDAMYDWEMWEKFNKFPEFLSFTPVAIVELKELPYIDEKGEGKVISVEELKKIGKIANDFTPVVYIRKHISNTRLQDIISDFDFDSHVQFTEGQKRDLALNPGKLDAFRRDILGVIDALNRKFNKKLNPHTYLLYMAEQLGTNFGILHGEDTIQKYAHAGNYSNAAEAIDFDSFDTLKRTFDIVGDIEKRIAENKIKMKDDLLHKETPQYGPLAALFKLGHLLVKAFPEHFPEDDKHFGIDWEHGYARFDVQAAFWDRYSHFCPQNADFLEQYIREDVQKRRLKVRDSSMGKESS